MKGENEMKGRICRGRPPCLPKALVVGVPRTLILSESGKRLEEEVDQDIKDGKVRTFECLDDMEKYLEK